MALLMVSFSAIMFSNHYNHYSFICDSLDLKMMLEPNHGAPNFKIQCFDKSR